jgi:hypothetical protein
VDKQSKDLALVREEVKRSRLVEEEDAAHLLRSVQNPCKFCAYVSNVNYSLSAKDVGQKLFDACRRSYHDEVQGVQTPAASKGD